MKKANILIVLICLFFIGGCNNNDKFIEWEDEALKIAERARDDNLETVVAMREYAKDINGVGKYIVLYSFKDQLIFCVIVERSGETEVLTSEQCEQKE